MKFDVKCPNGCGGYLTKNWQGTGTQDLFCPKCHWEHTTVLEDTGPKVIQSRYRAKSVLITTTTCISQRDVVVV